MTRSHAEAQATSNNHSCLQQSTCQLPYVFNNCMLSLQGVHTLLMQADGHQEAAAHW